MTMVEEITVPISSDFDVISVRQHGRRLAERAGFRGTDVTLIVTAISDVARKISEYAPPGEIDIAVMEESGKIGIVVTARSFSKDGSHRHWLPGTRRLQRLVDDFEIISKPEETAVTMKKWKQPFGSTMNENRLPNEVESSGGFNGSLFAPIVALESLS